MGETARRHVGVGRTRRLAWSRSESAATFVSVATDDDLARLVELIKVKNSADEAIARLVGRPCQIGHVGEWIAARIFDIDLHDSAVAPGSDGVLRWGRSPAAA